jgi:enoyl-[acyl-carrier protein] reductase I
MGLLEGKIGLVVGVANKNSIAWGVAQSWHAEGAALVFTYQGERFKQRVEELVETLEPGAPTLPCDVTSDESITSVFQQIKERFGRLDMLLHAVAFAPREALDGEFVNTSREAFKVALDVSAYSLVGLAREAAPLMQGGGSITALSFYGAEKVMPHYNVMGVAKAALEASTRYLAANLGQQRIRVNCISAGPVNTLAGRGISDFHTMMEHHQTHAPLKRNVLLEEIGATAAFLASDGAAAITGQVVYVDCGFSVMGM